MIYWKTPKTIVNPNRFGAEIKLRYLVLAFESGRSMVHYPVCGDAFAFSFFVNIGDLRRFFYAGWGKIPLKTKRSRPSAT